MILERGFEMKRMAHILMFVFPLLLLSLSISSCSSPESAEGPDWHIIGTITDSKTNLPIADATVELVRGLEGKTEKSTKTDENGNYSIEYNGQYFEGEDTTKYLRIEASKSGYYERGTQVHQTYKETQTINLALDPVKE
jgi:hypothetical protein